MTDQTCACPDCTCGTTADQAVERDNQRFCSEACADQHPSGEPCPSESCTCEQAGKLEGRPITEPKLDEALEETFPASDPISP